MGIMALSSHKQLAVNLTVAVMIRQLQRQPSKWKQINSTVARTSSDFFEHLFGASSSTASCSVPHSLLKEDNHIYISNCCGDNTYTQTVALSLSFYRPYTYTAWIKGEKVDTYTINRKGLLIGRDLSRKRCLQCPWIAFSLSVWTFLWIKCTLFLHRQQAPF